MTETNNNEIISITLLSDDCYLGDAYATACIAMGIEKTLEFLKKHRIDGVIICSNKKTYITE
jgi:thiamine biosynthesis lipoprotein